MRPRAESKHILPEIEGNFRETKGSQRSKSDHSITQLLSTTKVGYSAAAAGLSPDGKEAAVGGSDGKVRVYRVSGDSLEEEAVLERHRGPITAVRYSPDGAWIATADQNREAVVWDRGTREVRPMSSPLKKVWKTAVWRLKVVGRLGSVDRRGP